MLQHKVLRLREKRVNSLPWDGSTPTWVVSREGCTDSSRVAWVNFSKTVSKTKGNFAILGGVQIQETCFTIQETLFRTKFVEFDLGTLCPQERASQYVSLFASVADIVIPIVYFLQKNFPLAENCVKLNLDQVCSYLIIL